jgi:hypothetical protein
MELDLFSLIIIFITLSFFFVPIIYFEFYKKRKSKKFTSYFNEVANKNNVSISHYDVWRDKYAIGIDSEVNQILYLNKKDGKDEIFLIDLSNVTKCRISKDNQVIKSQTGDQRVTTQIDLNLELKDTKNPILTLVFFKGNNGDSVIDEVALSDKWSKLINSKINNR